MEKLIGRWFVTQAKGEPRYWLITEQSETFLAFLSPNGDRQVTSTAALTRLVEAEKVALR